MIITPIHEVNHCHGPGRGHPCERRKREEGRSDVGRIGASVRDEMLNEDPSLNEDVDGVCQINHGLCDQWAERVAAKLSGAVVVSDPDTDHYFVKYRGKFYDADRVNGVLNYRSLPYIKTIHRLAR